MAKQIKDMMNIEYKRTQIYAGQTALSNSAVIIPLTLVDQGVTESTRNGNRIKGSSISLKMDLIANTTAVGNIVRYLVVIDKASNGAYPTVGDLLDNTVSGSQVLSPYNNENAGSRFKILCDQRVNLDADGSTGRRFISKYFKLHHHLTYNNNTAAAAGLLTGHMYLFIVSSDNINTPSYSYTSVFSFIDN